MRPTNDIKSDCPTATPPMSSPFPLNDPLFVCGAKPDPQINVEVHDPKTT